MNGTPETPALWSDAPFYTHLGLSHDLGCWLLLRSVKAVTALCPFQRRHYHIPSSLSIDTHPHKAFVHVAGFNRLQVIRTAQSTAAQQMDVKTYLDSHGFESSFDHSTFSLQYSAFHPLIGSSFLHFLLFPFTSVSTIAQKQARNQSPQ